MQTFTVPHQYPVSIEFKSGIYTITYGAEIRETDNYESALEYLGQALMHALQCAGEFDND